VARFFKIHLDGFLMIEAESEDEAVQVAKKWNSFLGFNYWTVPDYDRVNGPLHWRQLNPPLIFERVPEGFVSCSVWLKDGVGYAEDVTVPFTDTMLHDPGFNGPG